MQKTPLLLLPGLVCDQSVWQAQIDGLQDHADIIVADLSTPDTPEKMVAAALQNAPQQFALAGHSMGGWVALEVMRACPERVTKLALLNTSAELDTPEKTKARNSMIQLVQNGRTAAVVDMLLTRFVHLQTFAEPIRGMVERNMHSFVSQEQAMLQRQDDVPLLNQITCPTLIVHANQDAVFSLANAQVMHAGIAHSQLVKIDNCGHMSLLEQADTVTQLLSEWLLI